MCAMYVLYAICAHRSDIQSSQLGLAGAVCNIAGAYIGAGMVLTKANKIVKPLIIVVLALLFIKIITK